MNTRAFHNFHFAFTCFQTSYVNYVNSPSSSNAPRRLSSVCLPIMFARSPRDHTLLCEPFLCLGRINRWTAGKFLATSGFYFPPYWPLLEVRQWDLMGLTSPISPFCIKLPSNSFRFFTGWWFQAFFIFHILGRIFHNILNWLSYFSEG